MNEKHNAATNKLKTAQSDKLAKMKADHDAAVAKAKAAQEKRHNEKLAKVQERVDTVTAERDVYAAELKQYAKSRDDIGEILKLLDIDVSDEPSQTTILQNVQVRIAELMDIPHTHMYRTDATTIQVVQSLLYATREDLQRAQNDLAAAQDWHAREITEYTRRYTALKTQYAQLRDQMAQNQGSRLDQLQHVLNAVVASGSSDAISQLRDQLGNDAVNTLVDRINNGDSADADMSAGLLTALQRAGSAVNLQSGDGIAFIIFAADTFRDNSQYATLLRMNRGATAGHKFAYESRIITNLIDPKIRTVIENSTKECQIVCKDAYGMIHCSIICLEERALAMLSAKTGNRVNGSVYPRKIILQYFMAYLSGQPTLAGAKLLWSVEDGIPQQATFTDDNMLRVDSVPKSANNKQSNIEYGTWRLYRLSLDDMQLQHSVVSVPYIVVDTDQVYLDNSHNTENAIGEGMYTLASGQYRRQAVSSYVDTLVKSVGAQSDPGATYYLTSSDTRDMYTIDHSADPIQLRVSTKNELERRLAGKEGVYAARVYNYTAAGTGFEVRSNSDDITFYLSETHMQFGSAGNTLVYHPFGYTYLEKWIDSKVDGVQTAGGPRYVVMIYQPNVYAQPIYVHPGGVFMSTLFGVGASAPDFDIFAPNKLTIGYLNINMWHRSYTTQKSDIQPIRVYGTSYVEFPVTDGLPVIMTLADMWAWLAPYRTSVAFSDPSAEKTYLGMAMQNDSTRLLAEQKRILGSVNTVRIIQHEYTMKKTGMFPSVDGLLPSNVFLYDGDNSYYVGGDGTIQQKDPIVYKNNLLVYLSGFFMGREIAKDSGAAIFVFSINRGQDDTTLFGISASGQLLSLSTLVADYSTSTADEMIGISSAAGSIIATFEDSGTRSIRRMGRYLQVREGNDISVSNYYCPDMQCVRFLLGWYQNPQHGSTADDRGSAFMKSGGGATGRDVKLELLLRQISDQQNRTTQQGISDADNNATVSVDVDMVEPETSNDDSMTTEADNTPESAPDSPGTSISDPVAMDTSNAVIIGYNNAASNEPNATGNDTQGDAVGSAMSVDNDSDSDAGSTRTKKSRRG